MQRFDVDTPEGFALTGPDGRRLEIPVGVRPGDDPSPPLTEPLAMKAFFDREGYVLARGLVPPSLCDAAVAAYEREVKPSRAFFRRHETDRPARHVLTEHGHMKYPIRNFHELERRRFPDFVDVGMRILTQPAAYRVLNTLLGGPGAIIHTLFLDGNQVTWAHHDSYYVDGDPIGSMVGIWVAAEDIDPGAGRFYVCPRSHRQPFPILGVDTDVDPNSEAYKQRVLRQMRDEDLRVYAPAMRKGDAIFWTSKTIHGSLETPRPERSRRSFTAFYVPERSDMLIFHQRRVPLQLRPFHGVPVHVHNDQNMWRYRAKYWLQAHSPESYALARRLRLVP